MHRLTSYQTHIARAILGSVLKERGETFTVELAKGAGLRELSAQLELLLLTLSIHAGIRLAKVMPQHDPSHARRLVERIGEGASTDRWAPRGRTVRLGRAEQRFVAPNELASLTGALSLIEVTDAETLDDHVFDSVILPKAQASGATLVLYGRPRNGRSWFERAAERNRTAEAGGTPRHFRVDSTRATAELPHYADTIEAARARLSADHPDFVRAYELRAVHALAPLLSERQREVATGAHHRQHAASPGARYAASVVVSHLHAAPRDTAMPVMLNSAATAVVTITAVYPRGTAKVVEHRWLEARDSVRLAWDVAKVLRGTWHCEQVGVSVDEGPGAAEFTHLLDQAIGHGRVAMLRALDGAQLSALVAALGTGALSVYATDGSVERRALAHEMREARVDWSGADAPRIHLPGQSAGFLKGLLLAGALAQDGSRAHPAVQPWAARHLAPLAS